MKKRKKKLKYCSVDPTRLLFSNFPGKLNPKKNFFRKSQDGSTGVINVHLTKQLPAGKQILTPSGELFMYYFRVPPSLSKQEKIVIRPRQLLYLHHSAVRQDLNALLNHFNFLCILFSFMYLCYNTLSSKPFV